MEPEFHDISRYANINNFFATEDGGTLRFDAKPRSSVKVTFSFALGFEYRSGKRDNFNEESDACFCRTRVADAEGSLWEAKTIFTTDVFLENMNDHRRDSAPFILNSATREIAKLFETPLLSGISDFYDDRSFRHFFVGKTYAVNFKYQTPTYDIALQENSGFDGILWVRASGFYASDTKESIPPFVFSIDCETLMFYSETRLPKPLIFRKVGVAKRKQPRVRHVPGGVPFPPVSADAS